MTRRRWVDKSRKHRVRLVFIGLFCLVAVVCFSGCEEIGFYRQAVSGEYQILAHEQSITKLMDDPQTPPELKAKFREVMKIRQFAADEMKLPVDDTYLKYTDLHRTDVVWNVNVAPPLSLEPKTWWFPIIGSASYRGYFNEQSARHYADGWEKKGWDVYVDGVDAYSTLGWFSDPLLNTFIDEPEADLAELIFHELGHRRLYVNGDTDFNEAYATEVAAEGLRRWFAASSNTVAFEEHETARIHDRQFVQLVMQTRDELGAVYADASLTDAQKLQRKQEVVERLRTRFALVRKSWGRDTGYDHWINGPINNAKLNTVSAYYELGPAFHALLLAQNGDIEKFYEAVATLAKLPLTKRHEALLAYLKPVTADNSH